MKSRREIDAIDALKKRQAENRSKERIDNASLYAGSPMYYYCRLCDKLIAVLPETHSERPPRYCGDCQKLINAGWSEGEQKFLEYIDTDCSECGGSGVTTYCDYYTRRPRYCTACKGKGKLKRPADKLN